MAFIFRYYSGIYYQKGIAQLYNYPSPLYKKGEI